MISSTCGSLRLVGPSALHMILDWRAPLQGHKDQPPPQGRPAPGLAPQGSNQTQTSAFSLDLSATGPAAKYLYICTSFFTESLISDRFCRVLTKQMATMMLRQ